MDEVKYPDVNVSLIGEDGNAFSILGRVQRAMRRKDVSEAEIRAYVNEATAGDYDNLLAVTCKYVNTNSDEEDELY